MNFMYKYFLIGFYVSYSPMALCGSGYIPTEHNVNPLHEFIPSVPTQRLHILSLDGGGVRGIAEVRILMRIEQITGKYISDLFHIIGGTSAGGMLSVLLTTPKKKGSKEPKYTCEDIFYILVHNTNRLFHYKYLSFGGLMRSKYSASHFHQVVETYTGNALMKDSIIPTAVFAFNTQSQKIEALASWHEIQYKKTDAISATAAAQTFFSPYKATIYTKNTEHHYQKREETNTFTDGGTGANNPTIMLLGNALNLFPKATEFEIVSIGSGDFNRPLGYDTIRGAGLITWADYLPRVFADSQQSSSHDFLDNLINQPRIHGDQPNIRQGGIYSRLSPKLSIENSRLDNIDAQNIHDIIEQTDKYLKKNKNLITLLCYRLNTPVTLSFMPHPFTYNRGDAPHPLIHKKN